MDAAETRSSRSSTISAGSLTDFTPTEVVERRSTSGTVADMPESVAHSNLFTLPREIRDRIYSLCLTARHGYSVEWPHLAGSNPQYGLQPQLLRVSKIIHDEAAPLLYTDNGITFHHPSDANIFVHAFASPSYSRLVTRLSLHIKAQDTRLWMSYLTSTDAKRSLKHDFPYLRELVVRFRSNRWNHAASPDVSMRAWSEDNRLDEIMRSLFYVYEERQQELASPERQAHLHRQSLLPFAGLLAEAKQRERSTDAHRPPLPALPPPVIRVVCAYRVNTLHFNMLTGSEPLPQAPPGSYALQPPPVKEGEPFRGFTALDLQTREVKTLQDPELGLANVVQTPFAEMLGVLLALEVHCLVPKRGNVDLPVLRA